MTDRQQIQDQLNRWLSELATIKTDMSDPEQACVNYGLTSDDCMFFKRNLGKEASQAEVAITILQKELCIYDSLAGTWTINLQGHSANSVGQFNITSLNIDRTFLGTMILTETSQATTISGSYNNLEQEITFRRSFPEGIVPSLPRILVPFARCSVPNRLCSVIPLSRRTLQKRSLIFINIQKSEQAWPQMLLRTICHIGGS